MSAFWHDAGQVFEVAAAATPGESGPCDLAILIQPDGAIRMLDASGWQLPALAAHSGADTVYRVTRQRGRVRVEGRSRTHSCLLQTEPPTRPGATVPPAWRAPLPALLPGPLAAAKPRDISAAFQPNCGDIPRKSTWI